ncbi:PP2C family protein-serine/threonine phosphatase [Planosporangium sp. 12N6]|uniref:PP2C family protein-serine/threonine phosphatase n=1 Tax=Planosporangium spinosum TaxID=3402278 RepID=UPI003CE7B316
MDPGASPVEGKRADPSPAETMARLLAENTELRRAAAENAQLRRAVAECQRRIAAERQLSEQLRQVVLPLPAAPFMVPGLLVAVRYQPAEHGEPVGGDWYHATGLADGTAILAVGDVAGHGLAAAAVMAELRHALAALAVTTTTDPAELLGHLNRILCDHDGERPRTATAAVGRFDRATGVLTWAQAGHPAPLLVRGGEVSELARPPGMLLGANVRSTYQTATVPLAAGDILLLYTDGLIESRGGSHDQGLDDVADSLLASVAEGDGCSLTDLLRRLGPTNPADDMCVLAARPCL